MQSLKTPLPHKANCKQYKYRIYLLFSRRPNTNIEYIHSKLIGRIQISNIFVTGKLIVSAWGVGADK